MNENPRIVNGIKLPPKRIIKMSKPVDSEPMVWFYHSGEGTEIGPVSINALRGRISRETLVWKNGMTEWRKVCDVPELAPVLASVRPELPTSVISERWVWALAAVPIPLGWFFRNICDGMEIPFGVFVAFEFLLNVIFLTLDIKLLKKAGRDIAGSLWLGIVFIPVYLFVRAAKYSKKYLPAIVWCALFAISIFCTRLSSGELSVRVRDAINNQYQQQESTRGVYYVENVALVRDADGGNTYHGTATVLQKAGRNGSVVNQVLTMAVVVTYDGSNFTWQIFPMGQSQFVR